MALPDFRELPSGRPPHRHDFSTLDGAELAIRDSSLVAFVMAGANTIRAVVSGISGGELQVMLVQSVVMALVGIGLVQRRASAAVAGLVVAVSDLLGRLAYGVDLTTPENGKAAMFLLMIDVIAAFAMVAGFRGAVAYERLSHTDGQAHTP